MLFYGGDDNKVNYGYFYSNKYGIGFTRGAENNQILEPSFDDNEDYGIYLYNSDFIQIKNNEITDNDGGIQFYLANSSNVTGNTIDGNGGKGIWLEILMTILSKPLSPQTVPMMI